MTIMILIITMMIIIMIIKIIIMIIMITKSTAIISKYSMPFCLISDAKRSWILYYQGRIISLLNKKKAWNVCFIICQTRSGKIKANKTH